MRSHRCLAGRVVVLLGAALAPGCVSLNQKTGSILPSVPTIGPWVASAIFNGGSKSPGIHGLGASWFLWPTPVSPALSQEIEDLLDRLEKDAVPILGPIRGEFAPVFCMDPPSDKDIYDTLAAIPHGVPFVYEVQRKSVRFNVEKLVDEIDPCRFFPLVGPCQLHHCHFRCTIWYDETTTMGWPIPWTYTDHK